jgi:glucosylglycerate synthase
MSTAPTISENDVSPSPRRTSVGLLVSLSALSPEGLSATLDNIAQAFPSLPEPVLVVTPDPTPPPSSLPSHVEVATYTPHVTALGGWVLTAADYLNTYKLVQEHNATACLQLGPQSQSLCPEDLRALADSVLTGKADLTTPHYSLSPREGLVNSSILYPTTRALYATRPRYPLAIDLAFSPRMAERLATCAQKFTATGQNAALIWPVAEAAYSGFSIAEVPAGQRQLPPPDAIDLNAVLAIVAGSFFADLDAKASYWQRARLAYSPKSAAPYADTGTPSSESGEVPDVQPMLDSFRLAYTNLHEIWSLVLPPNTLLGLKKLSLMPAASFRMPDALWARIVYDFILAYRLRTLNRGHLLGALTPLYLAWVASHLLLASGAAAESISPEAHIQSVAAAFETDKPYLVARWRWPDRFNP